ncbi:MAG: EscU/YscU/HrcU family type III secretion system export apparatus switch protein [Rickettsiales bacterium]|jgi:flagellar biosynthesis protein|nr:EscU/YscU/HrcU family type III secretion system export apparatus switch protein [Rickettsiales bacterium]
MATGDTPVDKDLLAVVLRYEKDKHEAPILSAKGKGYLALQIIELAKQYGIEIRKDEDLALLLSKLDVDAPIPLEAYAVVAEILAYVYKTNDAMKRKS